VVAFLRKALMKGEERALNPRIAFRRKAFCGEKHMWEKNSMVKKCRVVGVVCYVIKWTAVSNVCIYQAIRICSPCFVVRCLGKMKIGPLGLEFVKWKNERWNLKQWNFVKSDILRQWKSEILKGEQVKKWNKWKKWKVKFIIPLNF
jgi:hypothetical protein